MEETLSSEQIAINPNLLRFETELYRIHITENKFYISIISNEGTPLQRVQELNKLLTHVEDTIIKSYERN